MINFLHFLSKNRTLNLVIVFAYFLLVTLPHEWVGLQTVKVFGEMTRDNYNLTILLIACLLLFGYLLVLVRNLKQLNNKKIPIFYLLATVGLCVLSLNTLVIINIEIIHFIQYALLAILVFPLMKRFLPSLLFVMILGTIDEAYQYYILAPERTNYFDFNDVVLNTIGAAFGLVILRTYKGIGVFYEERVGSYFGKTMTVWFSIVALYYFFVSINFIQVWPIENGTNHWSLLVKKVPEAFWSVVHPNVTYHIILPNEGIIYMTLLLVFYSFLKTEIEADNT